MSVVKRRLSKTFKAFFDSEKAGGLLMIICTTASLLITNSGLGNGYISLWQTHIGAWTIENWINDAPMAIFFLLIGLELKRELYIGELSDFRNASLPVVAAVGGMCLPALIHFAFNKGTPAQAGLGIPMATDIAFALGALALVGNRVPASLRVFLTALAVIDDLGAVIVIAVFYTAKVSLAYLIAAILTFGLLIILNRLRVVSLVLYLIGGVVIWYLMLKSGVHATIAGVLLAFAIPFTGKEEDETSPSHQLEHLLQKPVAFIILPIFALANTGLLIGPRFLENLSAANSLGIILGLGIGKPLGITVLSLFAIGIGLCRLPLDLNWKHLFGAGILGGIGFTMSIFITNLAFANQTQVINASKIAILLASLIAGGVGFVWLKLFGKPELADDDLDTIDFEGT